MKEKQKTNRVLTIVLILGTVTVLFPLYMAVIIAFKKPSEMTNDIAGALSLPSSWSFSNFTEAMKVTDIYIERDFKIENEANSKVLKYVFGSGLQK